MRHQIQVSWSQWKFQDDVTISTGWRKTITRVSINPLLCAFSICALFIDYPPPSGNNQICQIKTAAKVQHATGVSSFKSELMSLSCEPFFHSGVKTSDWEHYTLLCRWTPTIHTTETYKCILSCRISNNLVVLKFGMDARLCMNKSFDPVKVREGECAGHSVFSSITSWINTVQYWL